MKQMLGEIEVLSAGCNVSTFQDGRGAIFTWLPNEPILEFNLLYFLPNKIRGNHFHPEFTEYFLVVDGSVLMVTREKASGKEVNMLASKGVCFRTPPNVAHAVHAITSATCVSLLTKEWDKCNPPIIHEDLIPFDRDYEKYLKETGKKNNE